MNALTSPQVDPAPRVGHEGWVCARCDKTDNLWLNLTDGVVGCGRRNWDGSGGNDHAAEHAAATGNLLAVKLGALTPALDSADVYEYDDSGPGLVSDPQLRSHLEHFGIDVDRLHKSDKTLAEMQDHLDVNSFYDFNSHQFVSTDASGAAAAASGGRDRRRTCAAELLGDLGRRGQGQGAIPLPPPALPVPRSLRALAAACARAAVGAGVEAGPSAARVALQRLLSPRRRRVPSVELTAAHNCDLCREDAGRAFADGDANAYLASLFLSVASGASAAREDLSFTLGRYDLFHGHFFAYAGGLGFLMHAKEYPTYNVDFPFHLGHCQKGSGLGAAGLATRNILWLLPAASEQRRVVRGRRVPLSAVGPSPRLAVLDCSPGTRLARELCGALLPAPLVYEGDLGGPLGDVTYLAALEGRKPRHRIFVHL